MPESYKNSYQIQELPDPCNTPSNSKYISKEKLSDVNDGKDDTKTTLLKICFITLVATFNFSIYFFLTDTLSLTFFSEPDNEFVAMLQFIGLIAAGFVARPIGGYLIGRFGDKNGRKLALLVTTIIFLFTTIITIFLPTYSQAGIISPILLIIIRLLQGAAFGAQLILSWVYIAETLNSTRLNIGISLICAMSIMGTATCAITSGVLEFFILKVNYINYGWRVFFVISAFLTLICLFLIRNISETPVFIKASKIQSNGFKKYIQRHQYISMNLIIKASLLSFIFSNLSTIIIFIIPKLIKLRYSIEPSMLHTANILGMLSMAVGALFYGWLSKSIGMGKALILGSMLLAVQSFIFFYYLSQFGGNYIILMYSILGFSMGIISLCILLILKLFPINTRLKSIAIIFNTVSVFSGAILPIFILYTTSISRFSPVIYLMFLSFIIFMLGLHSTSSLGRHRLLK